MVTRLDELPVSCFPETVPHINTCNFLFFSIGCTSNVRRFGYRTHLGDLLDQCIPVCTDVPTHGTSVGTGVLERKEKMEKRKGRWRKKEGRRESGGGGRRKRNRKRRDIPKKWLGQRSCVTVCSKVVAMREKWRHRLQWEDGGEKSQHQSRLREKQRWHGSGI